MAVESIQKGQAKTGNQTAIGTKRESFEEASINLIIQKDFQQENQASKKIIPGSYGVSLEATRSQQQSHRFPRQY